MPHFSRQSKENLRGLHPSLIMLCFTLIEHIDFSVTSGIRTVEEQQALYAKGRTEPGPVVTNCDGVNKKSNHQINEESGYGHAVDIYPYPMDDLRSLGGLQREKALRRFVGLAFAIKGMWIILKEEGKLPGDIRWGGDWDSDFDFADQDFDDLPHIEFVV